MESDKKQNNSNFNELRAQIDPELLMAWEKEQDSLKKKLIVYDDLNFDPYSVGEGKIKRIGGMDISASKHYPNTAIVALVICEGDNLEVIYEKYEFVKLTQPYVPGFLAFKEVDHLLKLLNDLKKKKPELMPQIILTDGNGILHNRGFGLACHLGVLSDIPTVGCGKTVFSVDGINKNSVKELSNKTLKKAGDHVELKGKSGKVYGAALKSTNNTINPMIINIGHKISLDSALKIVKWCTLYRVPEPIRVADKRSRILISKFEEIGGEFNIEKYINENQDSEALYAEEHDESNSY